VGAIRRRKVEVIMSIDPSTQRGLISAAIVYDFDGTLAEGNIQEHSLLPTLGLEPRSFWGRVKAETKSNDADEILIYMWLLLREAQEKGISLTSKMLADHGRDVRLFDGVESWFGRVNQFAAVRGLDLKHYVISSGLKAMIRGCPVHGSFSHVFASDYLYSESGEALWPGSAINYTTKTQFLFRINKGIPNNWDNVSINKWVPLKEREIPFERMIFLGDGDTDIPTMKMMRHQGGCSIAVFDPKTWDERAARNKIGRLIAEDRVQFVAPADYSEGSQLDVTVRGILGRIARDEAGFREPVDGGPTGGDL
jgi:hypothetical protein